MILADPLDPSAPENQSVTRRPRRRWELWRSPDGQPGWARPALLVIAAVAAALYAWNITQAGLAPFYSVAVKSMSVSWKAFFYGALDPKATVTIDKLAGSFLPQALSARIFGFHAWSVALPQVIEGVIAVLAMYRVVRRWAGVVPGLLAAAIFALTPIAASMFGHSMEDGALTMCLVLAADAYQRAVSEGRLRSLLMAGVWVGLGFQAKMLQAWMVLPALAIGYLVSAPGPVRRRLAHLGAAAVVMLAVSLSWIALYTFTPAADRPYVDGSTDNSAVAMVFGYNGVERFGISFSGAVTSGPGVTSGSSGGGGAPGATSTAPRASSTTAAPAGTGGDTGTGTAGSAPSGAPGSGTGSAPAGAPGTGGAGTSGAGGAPEGLTQGSGAPASTATRGGGAPGGGSGGFGTGWTKLLGSEYGTQIGWLYPLAVLAVVFGIAWTRRARRTEPAGQVRGGFVMWGAWLATYGLIFSKMSTIPHTAYMSSLAPPLAALSGAGIVMFWRAYRAEGWRGWVLPVAVAAEVAWAFYLWRDYSGFLPWARDFLVAAGAVAVVALVVARLYRAGRTQRAWARVVTVALGTGVVAMLAAPATWAASVLDVNYAGSSFNATAGPAGGMGGFGGGGQPVAAQSAKYAERFADRAAGDLDPGAAAGGATGAGGAPGGIGSSATVTLTTAEQRLYDYVSAHRDGASYLMAVSSWEEASPYILATGQEVMPMGGFSGTVPAPTLAAVKHLVSTGQLKFFLISGAGSGGGFGGGGGSTAATIDAWVESTCQVVPATDYTSGATATASASGQSLYACSTAA
jgi:4-amino-4-deoxy-L-arabinose transferase-like glycosyltransferase